MLLVRSHLTIAVTAMAVAFLPACTTTQDSVLLGAGSGIAVGAGLGVAAGQPYHSELRSGAVGALTGAIFGGLVGFLAHKDDKEKAAVAKHEVDETPAPTLTKPVVHRVWISDRVEGDRLVRGHWEYVLEKGSAWSN